MPDLTDQIEEIKKSIVSAAISEISDEIERLVNDAVDKAVRKAVALIKLPEFPAIPPFPTFPPFPEMPKPEPTTVKVEPIIKLDPKLTAILQMPKEDRPERILTVQRSKDGMLTGGRIKNA